MTAYCKLFQSILTSTIWQEEPSCKVLWITILALKDSDHVCRATIPGLARFAGISIDDCEKFIRKFLEPDKYSRSKEFEGRRLEAVDGGWLVLNGKRYRDQIRAVERREYMRKKATEYRARDRESVDKIVDKVDTSLTKSRQKTESRPHTYTDTDTEVQHLTSQGNKVCIVELSEIRGENGRSSASKLAALSALDSDAEKQASATLALPDPEKSPISDPGSTAGYSSKRSKSIKPESREILTHLNSATGRSYRETESNLGLISARLSEPGVDTAGIRKMIDRQSQLWGSDLKMSEFLRPATLFAKEKFGSYYDNRDQPLPGLRTVNSNGVRTYISDQDQRLAVPYQKQEGQMTTEQFAKSLGWEMRDKVSEIAICKAHHYAIQFSTNEKPRWLSIIGQSNGGKTMLGRAIYKALERMSIGRQFEGRYVAWPTVELTIRESRSSILEEVSKLPVVMVDNIPPDKHSLELISALCLREKKWTIITSAATANQVSTWDSRVYNRMTRNDGIIIEL